MSAKSAEEERPLSEPERTAMNRAMTRTAIATSMAAGGLMLFGFILLLLRPDPIPGGSDLDKLPAPRLPQLLSGEQYRTASTYLGLGLIVLALTPILRVVVALNYFWRQRNIKYVAAAFGVLAILLISLVLAWR